MSYQIPLTFMSDRAVYIEFALYNYVCFTIEVSSLYIVVRCMTICVEYHKEEIYHCYYTIIYLMIWLIYFGSVFYVSKDTNLTWLKNLVIFISEVVWMSLVFYNSNLELSL